MSSTPLPPRDVDDINCGCGELAVHRNDPFTGEPDLYPPSGWRWTGHGWVCPDCAPSEREEDDYS